MRSKLGENKQGFALVEGILLLVIVAAVIGVGVYVIHQKHKSEKTLASNSGTSAQTKAPAGSTASVDQLTQQDSQTEASVDSSADGTAQQDAMSANSAVSNLGGAYNEASY